jgi:hypothetical protein
VDHPAVQILRGLESITYCYDDATLSYDYRYLVRSCAFGVLKWADMLINYLKVGVFVYGCVHFSNTIDFIGRCCLYFQRSVDSTTVSINTQDLSQHSTHKSEPKHDGCCSGWTHRRV